MLDLFILLFLCTVIAKIISPRLLYVGNLQYNKEGNLSYYNKKSKYIFGVIAILLMFLFFSGLRTAYNDTETYIQEYKYFSSSEFSLGDLLKPYGGFTFLKFFCKVLFKDNPQPFIFICSAIANIIFIRFIYKYSYNFGDSIFLYGTGMFIFAMAGLKQTIAISIALFYIESFLNGKYLKAIISLFIALLFHPYIVCLLILPFLYKKALSWRTLGIIILIVFAFFNIELVLRFASIIGKDYIGTNLFDSYTINPTRVLVEAVPVFIIFINRNKLNKSKDSFVILSANMQIISFLFIFSGLFMNPIYPGRMSSYFGMLSGITMPRILRISFSGKRNAKFLIFAYYIFVLIYFIMDFTKLGSISFSTDRFKHVPISALFQ